MLAQRFYLSEIIISIVIHSIRSVQNIPATLEQVWDFYSHHANLQTITPPQMKFRIISKDQADNLYSGQIIEYKVTPLAGIPLYWKTEIKNVTPPVYFMDEQQKGPFSIWQHQHMFKTVEGGVEMTDIVLYKAPLWLMGELANILFLKRKLRNIFAFRFQKMEEIFGQWPGGHEIKIVIN